MTIHPSDPGKTQAESGGFQKVSAGRANSWRSRCLEAPKALLSGTTLSEQCVVMPVGLYLRVSSEEQRERQSIATQREFALRYCALHQLAIYQTYSDDGVSGTDRKSTRLNSSHL